MALTRKFLSAMGIESDKIDEIINAHMETVDGLKSERDDLKKSLTDIKGSDDDMTVIKKKLHDAEADLKKFKDADWEKQYTELKKEYDEYKSTIQSHETKIKKTEAYRKLLKDVGISEKRIDSILKITSMDDIELDDAGALKNVDELKKSVKENFGEFIVTLGEKGANISTPPGNNGDSKPTGHAAKMLEAYRNTHYGNPMKEE